jgi:hypothetical protein
MEGMHPQSSCTTERLCSVAGNQRVKPSPGTAAVHAPSRFQVPATQVAVTLPVVEPRHTPEQVVPSLKVPCLLTALLQVCQPMNGPGKS